MIKERFDLRTQERHCCFTSVRAQRKQPKRHLQEYTPHDRPQLHLPKKSKFYVNIQILIIMLYQNFQLNNLYM